MKIIAILAFTCSPWLCLLLPIERELAPSWSRAFDFNFAVVSKAWPAATNQAAILVVFGAATILLSLSSWYMLRQE